MDSTEVKAAAPTDAPLVAEPIDGKLDTKPELFASLHKLDIAYNAKLSPSAIELEVFDALVQKIDKQAADLALLQKDHVLLSHGNANTLDDLKKQLAGKDEEIASLTKELSAVKGSRDPIVQLKASVAGGEIRPAFDSVPLVPASEIRVHVPVEPEKKAPTPPATTELDAIVG